VTGLNFTGSIFTGVHNFFHSGTWHAVSLGLVALVMLFWLATVYWVNKDARRRIEQRSVVAVVAVVGAIPPFLGRRSTCSSGRRSTETYGAEIRAIRAAWAARPNAGSVACGRADFLVCPV
jgi:hypothetical protein